MGDRCTHKMTRNPKEDQEDKCRLCGLPYKPVEEKPKKEMPWDRTHNVKLTYGEKEKFRESEGYVPSYSQDSVDKYHSPNPDATFAFIDGVLVGILSYQLPRYSVDKGNGNPLFGFSMRNKDLLIEIMQNKGVVFKKYNKNGKLVKIRKKKVKL